MDCKDDEYKKLADEIVRVQYPYWEQMDPTVINRAEILRDKIADKIKYFVEGKLEGGK